MFVDTHTHLYAAEFDEDRDAMVQRALQNNVGKILLPNIEASSIAGMKALCDKYPQNCYAMVGLHPCSVKENFEEELAIVEKELFGNYKYCAVGEMGLDLYWDKSLFEQQKIAFARQVKWSIELNLPLSIHTREATDEAIELLSSAELKGARGVFHCFSGNAEQAKKVVDLGFYLGIGGVLTFKNSGLDKVVENIPLECLVLETDAPYLAPVPYRGKRNESSYIPIIAHRLAVIKALPIEDIEEVTTRNALTIFGIG